ncbi:MAG: hypothetical protein ACRDID_05815, partial [Ktedonobacterales bacterium]
IEQGAAFLLDYDLASAAYPAGWSNTKPSPRWFGLGFPLGYTADLLRLATLGGADALGLLADLGALTPGKLARFAAAPLDALDATSRASPDATLAALMAGRAPISAVRL